MAPSNHGNNILTTLQQYRILDHYAIPHFLHQNAPGTQVSWSSENWVATLTRLGTPELNEQHTS